MGTIELEGVLVQTLIGTGTPLALLTKNAIDSKGRQRPALSSAHRPPVMDNPLEEVEFADVLQHGDPGKWRFTGTKPGSGVPATSPDAPRGTVKVYELYLDESGREIELHYFRHPDGRVSGVKVTPRS